MSPKAKLKALIEAHIVLRNLGLGEIDDPILSYRCHKAALELGEIRSLLRSQWGIKTLVLCAVCLVAQPVLAATNILEWEASPDAAQYQIFYGLDWECLDSRPLEKSVSRFDKSILTYTHTIPQNSGNVCYEVLAWDSKNYSSLPSNRVTKNLDAPLSPKNFQVK